MNKISELLKAHESWERHAYKDSRGFTTIGIGRNVDKRNGPGLRDSEIEHMLQNDIQEYFMELMQKLPFFKDLSFCRQDVLLDMRHNLGSKGFFDFRKMLSALSLQDYTSAAREILNSDAARAPERGLRKRYRILSAMMTSNRYPSYLP